MPTTTKGKRARASSKDKARVEAGDAPKVAAVSVRARLPAHVVDLFRAVDRVFVEGQRAGLDFFDAMAARTLIMEGLTLLTAPSDVAALEAVRSRLRIDPDAEDQTTGEIARLVDVAAAIWKRREKPGFRRAAQLVAKDLQAAVAAQLAPQIVPDLAAVQRMLERHTDGRAPRGKLTTIGFVANLRWPQNQGNGTAHREDCQRVGKSLKRLAARRAG